VKLTLIILGLLGGLLVLVVLALGNGAGGVSLAQIAAGLDETQRTIVWDLRLPRLLLAIGAGAALAVSGALMQTYFRNPLAEPYITGVSAGGALGAVVGASLGLLHPLAIGGSSLLGAAAITAALYLFALRPGRGSLALLLLGVALGTLCGALVWLILLRLGPADSSAAISWLLGRVSTVGYTEALALLAAAALGLAGAWLLAPQLDALLLGDEKAASLGLNVMGSRRLVLAVATLLAAASVAFCGVIAFVGLMVPHVARQWTGSTHLRLLPVVALGGAVLVLGIDLLSRVIAPPAEFPLTVLTSLLGAPFFIGVLLRSREVAV
jgi:iron complex transport system permease protein